MCTGSAADALGSMRDGGLYVGAAGPFIAKELRSDTHEQAFAATGIPL
jgi:hypothetical protein